MTSSTSDISTIDMKVGFVGAGKMAQAMAFGFLSVGLMKSDQIIVSAPTERNLASLKERGFQCSNENSAVLEFAKVIFIAVKPNLIEKVLGEICNLVSDHLIVSVAAGIKIETIEDLLPPGARVIRCAPNTPVQYGAGVTVFSRGSNVSENDVKMFTSLLEGVGICEEVTEYQINSVTGIAGSGTAFVLSMMQSLADGAVKTGLPRHLANSFAAQTFLGTAKMVVESGKHPAVLQEEVSSPGGTTIHGLHELEKGAVGGSIMNAVEAAVKRANQLG